METLKHILDLTYELEGLLELALRRDDARAAIMPLITDKIATIHAAATAAEIPPATSTPPSPVFSAAVPPAAPPVAPAACPPPIPVAGAPEITEDAPEAFPGVQTIGTLPFSINDKFRFRRELFGNDNDRYMHALSIIADMSSIDEVRDYLCNDLELAEESPEVQAFLERVRALANL